MTDNLFTVCEPRADVLQGTLKESDLYSPWGELAHALAGEAGFRLVERSDTEGIAPVAPLRFLAEANLTQIIRREETNIDREEARSRLNAYIRDLFTGPNLNLVGDDVFIKGIRQGIDLGDYVYKSGDLVRGKGDPHAKIRVDEQSFVYTASYAGDHAIWSRPASPPAPPAEAPPPSGVPPAQYKAGPAPTPPAKMPGVVEAEDVLKAALTRVLELARNNGALTLDSMTIRPFDKGDALKLIPLVNSVPNAIKRIELEASFKTSSKSEAIISFKRDLDDATPLKVYLEPQFRAASECDASVSFGMAMHRKYPRRVLMALRFLLIEPTR